MKAVKFFSGIFLFFGTCSAIWVGEDYWTTVKADGSLLGDRRFEDFLTFTDTHHDIPMTNAYVAFWITYDANGHYETFGQAFLDANRVCARFVDRYYRARTLCGGFRVLSKSTACGNWTFKFVPVAEANVHQALEYRNLQVAKVVSINKNEAWYGSAHLNEGTAEGIDYQGFHIKLSYGDDPYFFSNYVFILMAVPRVARDYPSPYFDSDNTDEEKHRRSFHEQQQLREHRMHHRRQQHYIKVYQPYEEYPPSREEPEEKWKFYHSRRR